MHLRMFCCALIVIGHVEIAWADEPAIDTPVKFPGERLTNSQTPFLSAVVLGNSSAKYMEGEILSLTFQADVDVHLYLMYHQPDGTTLLLYPNPSSGTDPVPAETKVKFPPENGRFRFRIQAPFGHDVLQVVASTKSLTELESLIDEKKKTAPTVSQKILDELTDRLLADLTTWTEHRITLETVAKSK